MKIVDNLLKNFTSSGKKNMETVEHLASEIDKEILAKVVLRTIKIARTKGGTPCLWESYSEFDNLVRTTVITNETGEIKNSVFVRNRKNKQALIPVDAGDCIVKVFKDTVGIAISVLIIHEVSSQKNEATIYPTFRKESSEEKTIPQEYENAINLCIEKLENSDLIISELAK
jgi:hypothetical protein